MNTLSSALDDAKFDLHSGDENIPYYELLSEKLVENRPDGAATAMGKTVYEILLTFDPGLLAKMDIHRCKDDENKLYAERENRIYLWQRSSA